MTIAIAIGLQCKFQDCHGCAPSMSSPRAFPSNEHKQRYKHKHEHEHKHKHKSQPGERGDAKGREGNGRGEGGGRKEETTGQSRVDEGASRDGPNQNQRIPRDFWTLRPRFNPLGPMDSERKEKGARGEACRRG